MRIKFSVVMSVYMGDHADHLILAYRSLCDQTLSPTEIIISIDGPISDVLDGVINLISNDGAVKVVRSDVNRGAGFARNLAIQQAKYPIIAIMDADDLCESTRFEKQLHYISNGKADLVGSLVEEFIDNPHDSGAVRLVPENHDEIFDYGKWRQPVNHVSVVFTKSVYDRVGGYLPIRFHEDYDFLVRLLVSGVQFYNVQDILVHVRIGNNMINRRAGLGYLNSEIRLFYKMYLLSYISIGCLIANILTRILFRFMPKVVMVFVYSKILRRTV